MANGQFNIAKGKINEYWDRVDSNDPTNSAIIMVMLTANVADGTLEDFDDLSALLADAGNTEAIFTNYVRPVLTDTDLTAPTPDDTNNRQDASIPQVTITSAGGATNNTMTKVLLCYDPDTTGGTDANIVPLMHFDYTETTDGTDLIINAGVVFRAT